jgi:DNA-3-methyladenine glycosylase
MNVLRRYQGMARAIKAKSLQTRSTAAVARFLLGKLLVRKWPDGKISRHRITEVEAYHGEKDLACHASKGRTKRTDVMYGPGGVWYVYLCYGIHEMLNLVTGPEAHPAAVLIRGVQNIAGPGRVTKQLAIDRALNGAPAARSAGLWLEDDGFVVSRGALKITPRIGVDYAGPIWAAKPWRFHFTPVVEMKPTSSSPGGRELLSRRSRAAPEVGV